VVDWQAAETVQLAQLIESCGVSAIAVHGRTRDERPKHSNHDDVIAAVAEAVSIPVIAKWLPLHCHYLHYSWLSVDVTEW